MIYLWSIFHHHLKCSKFLLCTNDVLPANFTTLAWQASRSQCLTSNVNVNESLCYVNSKICCSLFLLFLIFWNHNYEMIFITLVSLSNKTSYYWPANQQSPNWIKLSEQYDKESKAYSNFMKYSDTIFFLVNIWYQDIVYSMKGSIFTDLHQ